MILCKKLKAFIYKIKGFPQKMFWNIHFSPKSEHEWVVFPRIKINLNVKLLLNIIFFFISDVFSPGNNRSGIFKWLRYSYFQWSSRNEREPQHSWRLFSTTHHSAWKDLSLYLHACPFTLALAVLFAWTVLLQWTMENNTF